MPCWGFRMAQAGIGTVVFGCDSESFRPIKKGIAEGGMEVIGEVRDDLQRWAIEVSCEHGRQPVRVLDRIVWSDWWKVNTARRTGIHPNKALLRAMTYKAISEKWPPSARSRR